MNYWLMLSMIHLVSFIFKNTINLQPFLEMFWIIIVIRTDCYSLYSPLTFMIGRRYMTLKQSKHVVIY